MLAISLIPKELPDRLLDDELATVLLQYFHGVQQEIEKQTGGQLKEIYERAFYDTLGGYLRNHLVAMAKYSFYAGIINLGTVESILDLYDECKYQGNTNGNGWRAPMSDFTNFHSEIEPLKITIHDTDEDTSCVQLDLLDNTDGEDEDMIVQLPHLDPEEKGLIGNIWIPFKRRHSFDLKSSMSCYVLLRYFDLTTRCYSFQGLPQETFNKKFRTWILENLEVHLEDDVLYPGLGAILRIVENLHRKGIVVRNDKGRYAKDERSAKKKTRDGAKSSESWLNRVFGEHDVSGEKRLNRRHYLTIVGVVVTSILVFCIGLICLLKSLRDAKSGEQSKKPKVVFKLGKRKSDDEEVLLGPQSSSVVSSAPQNESQPVEDQMQLPTVEEEKPKPSSKSRKKGDISPPQAPRCFRLCTRVSSASASDPSGSRMDMVDEKKAAGVQKER